MTSTAAVAKEKLYVEVFSTSTDISKESGFCLQKHTADPLYMHKKNHGKNNLTKLIVPYCTQL